MVNLKQLQRENQRLRGMQRKLRDIEKNNEDRVKLLRENKMLARNIKFDKSLKIGRRASKIAKDVGKPIGRGVVKAGIGAFKGLQRYANFLAEQERRQKSLNRKLKSARKSKRR